eukprot:1146490-Pelagomonas_calceolata.AAC.1
MRKNLSLPDVPLEPKILNITQVPWGCMLPETTRPKLAFLLPSGELISKLPSSNVWHVQVEGVDKQLALAAQALEGASGGGRTGSATTADGHETNALCSGGAMEEDPMNVKQEQI